MKFFDDDKLYERLFNLKRKKFRKMESILKDWYGPEHAELELTHYLPKEENLKDIVENILSKNIGPNEQKFLELKRNWGKIMGSQIEKISQPVSLKNNFLTIEVENSAWLMELKTFQGRLIEKKIKDFCGEHFFYRINYILKGYKKTNNLHNKG